VFEGRLRSIDLGSGVNEDALMTVRMLPEYTGPGLRHFGPQRKPPAFLLRDPACAVFFRGPAAALIWPPAFSASSETG
jgi:hypothetical protein